MPIWGWLSVYSALLAVIALAGGDRRGFQGLALITLALFFVQLWKHAGLGGWIWLAFAATWAAVAVAVFRLYGAKSRHSVTVSVLLICVSLCYLCGRVAGMPFNSNAPVLLWADVLGVLAWTTMARPGVHGLVGKFAGSRTLGHGFGRAASLAGNHPLAATERGAGK